MAAPPSHRTHGALIALAWLIATAGTAWADPPTDAVWRALRDRPVRVELSDGTSVQGVLLSSEGTSAVIARDDGRVVEVRKDRVEDVRLRSGPESSDAGEGGAAGAAGASETMARLDSLERTRNEFRQRADQQKAGGVLGLTMGATFLGAGAVLLGIHLDSGEEYLLPPVLSFGLSGAALVVVGGLSFHLARGSARRTEQADEELERLRTGASLRIGPLPAAGARGFAVEVRF